MKNFKKIASAIAALSLAACVAVPMSATVFTASATLVKAPESSATEENHTYTAYQIFTGTYGEGGVLGDVEWVTGFDNIGLLADEGFTSIVTVGSDTSAKAVAEAISKVTDKSGDAEKLAQVIRKYVGETGTPITATGANLEAGYYIIVDDYTDIAEDFTKKDAKSYHLLQVFGGDEVTISLKKGTPTLEKKLKDVNDSQAEVDKSNPTDWQDSADYDIGDTVPFRLKATLPSADEYARYKSYKLIFHDDLSTNSGTAVFDDPTDFVCYADLNENGIKDDGEEITTGKSSVTTGGDFTYTIEDLKAVGMPAITATTPIYLEYNAVLNNNAVLGSKGNWNEAYLEYSNNPNYEGEGDTGDENTTDKTPKDTVVVFTYETDINKIKPDNSELAGAKFTLYKKYATAPDAKTVLGSSASAADLNEYGIDSSDWYEVKEYTTGKETKFAFKGLDDGEYLLVETEAPAGYNKLTEPIEFKITAEHDETADTPTLKSLTGTGVDGEKTSGEITLSGTVESGILSADIKNEQGATLPSTGGIGTTLFYLGGGALVAVAGVMLITKKRMTKE